MASIHEIPNELLERIFLEGCEPPHRGFEDAIVIQHHRPDFATTVSHVSALWRAVALRKNRLWTGIVASDAQPHSLDRVRAYRFRAGNAPLDLQVILCGPSHDSETTYRYLERADRMISDMAFTALPTASWGNLDSLFFRGTHHGQAWTLLSEHLRSTAMPLLTSLVVDIQPLPDAPLAEIHSEVFDLTTALGGVEIAPTFAGITPRLETLALRNVPRCWLPLLLTHTISVRHVTLSLWKNDARVPPARFLSQLARCTALEHLSISTSGPVLTDWQSQATASNVVTLPELRTLRLQGDAPGRLLPYIDAPQLLRLDLLETALLSPGVPLTSLATLALVRTPVSRTGLFAQALGEHSFPALQTLVLCETDERFLTELHLVPLPSLKTITLLRPKSSSYSPLMRSLRGMLEARARAGRRLEELVLDPDIMDGEIVLCEILRAFVETLRCISVQELASINADYS